MRIQAIPVESLHFDGENPRHHNDRNMSAIKHSLQSHGQVEPLVVQRSTRMVIAGNGRLLAMQQLGWDQAQCVLLDVDDHEARELSIKLNRTGELASWNDSVLAGHISALAELKDDFDLETFGFNEEELEKLLSDFDETTKELEESGAVADSALPPGTQPSDMPSAKMREIKLFLDPDDYNGFSDGASCAG